MAGKKISRSIFVKLIVIIVLYGILINISVALFFRTSKEFKPKRFVYSKFNEYVIKDIGMPPDTAKARKLSQDLFMNIRLKYKDMSWTSSEEIPTLEEISKSEDFQESIQSKESFLLHYKDKMYGINKIPDGVFITSGISSSQESFNPEKAVITLLVMLSIIFIPLYFLLRWLFNPLISISLALKQIGEGNYDVELPLKRRDEFGELARSLKEMSSKIKNSIKAKEQLLIDVSHELRTPLTRIKFGLELDTPKEKINEDVTEIERMVKSILLNYRENSHYTDVFYSEINIYDLLQSVISRYDSDKIIFIPKSKNGNDFNMITDGEKIKIVLINVIDNAIKYSSKNDKVEVELKDENNFVEIIIRDKGIGISENDLKNIFEPFYRADISRSRKTGGFGLGLTIVKKIMDSLEADIDLKSKINEGTSVYLKFKKN